MQEAGRLKSLFKSKGKKAGETTDGRELRKVILNPNPAELYIFLLSHLFIHVYQLHSWSHVGVPQSSPMDNLSYQSGMMAKTTLCIF